jgi:hypothetical protein
MAQREQSLCVASATFREQSSSCRTALMVRYRTELIRIPAIFIMRSGLAAISGNPHFFPLLNPGQTL